MKKKKPENLEKISDHFKIINDLEFSDRQVAANSVDPDQNAPSGATQLTIPSSSFRCIIMSPTEGEGDIMFLVRILLVSALASA